MEHEKYTLPHEKRIAEYAKTIGHLCKQNQDNPIFQAEISRLEQALDKLKDKVYSQLSAWERVLISRHPKRPHTLDYATTITESFVELHGDRQFGDDASIIGGFARIGDMRCMLIGQEKGHDTESRLQRNFGMVNPEGFRKALRLMKLAEKFKVPIVTLMDTPGAYAGLEAELRGQGWAIAMNLREMAHLETPIISVVIGEGCSGGALGIGMGDVVGMLEHAYYSVISPESCAAILWKDTSKKQQAAESLKLTSEDLLKLGIIDEIIPEPLGGAHHDQGTMYARVRNFILDQWNVLKNIPKNVLLEQRYLKYRCMGRFLSI